MSLPHPSGASPFEDGFEARLRSAPDGTRLTALVDLKVQVDLEAWSAELLRAGLPKTARRQEVIRALEATAEAAQAAIRPRLDRLVEEGLLDYARTLAIVDRVVVEGSAAGILAIGGWPEVAAVRPDWTSQRSGPRSGRAEPETAQPLGDHFESWALRAMNVDAAWSRGLDGKGILVASIDTGAYGDHEQLRGRMAPGGRGWFDPVQAEAEAYDSHGHGTGVLAQAVGGNPDGRVLGVAPGATWAAALGNWRNFYSRSRMSVAADWVLRVARPDVLINAWSHDEGACSDFDRRFIDAWRAAEIVVLFPAGNAGPGASTGEAPATLGEIVPGRAPVFAVAGLSRSGEVWSGSSRGPSLCGSPRFPSVAAPAESLPAPLAGNPRGYESASGTSLSAGLAGGVAALLLPADPGLGAADVERILLESSRDLPPPGPDPSSGAGAIDVAAALDRLRGRGGR